MNSENILLNEIYKGCNYISVVVTILLIIQLWKGLNTWFNS